MTSKDHRGAAPFSPMRVDENEDEKSNHVTVPSSPPFRKDQRVWAQDPVTCRYYHATVRDLRWEASEWKFRIHYQGWNSRWDRWLVASHIAEENQTEYLRAAGLLTSGKEATQAIVQEGEEDAENEEIIVHATASCRKRKIDATDPSRATTSVSSRKRRTTKNRKALPYAEYCELPITLQTVLVEEWERLTRPIQNTGKPPSRLVHSLPASVTIHQVLKHFAKKQKQDVSSSDGGSTKCAGKKSSDVDDFCTGISQLFQTSLPKCLLYNQERPQHEALTRVPELSGKSLTEIYGCEYLLRLYVRLPYLLPNVDESVSTSILGPLLTELLILLQKNRQACFKGDYRRPMQNEWLENETKLQYAVENNTNMEEETMVMS